MVKFIQYFVIDIVPMQQCCSLLENSLSNSQITKVNLVLVCPVFCTAMEKCCFCKSMLGDAAGLKFSDTDVDFWLALFTF